jgi:hypothetical protein
MSHLSFAFRYGTSVGVMLLWSLGGGRVEL